MVAQGLLSDHHQDALASGEPVLRERGGREVQVPAAAKMRRRWRVTRVALLRTSAYFMTALREVLASRARPRRRRRCSPGRRGWSAPPAAPLSPPPPPGCHPPPRPEPAQRLSGAIGDSWEAVRTWRCTRKTCRGRVEPSCSCAPTTHAQQQATRRLRGWCGPSRRQTARAAAPRCPCGPCAPRPPPPAALPTCSAKPARRSAR